MYEVWTIAPANLVMTFDTAAQAEREIQRIVAAKGSGSLRNHAVIFDDDRGNAGDVAEAEAILPAMTRLRVLEEMSAVVSRAIPLLGSETGSIVDASGASLRDIKVLVGDAHSAWLDGFLAAALHGVSIDLEAGQLVVGKSLDEPVFKPVPVEAAD